MCFIFVHMDEGLYNPGLCSCVMSPLRLFPRPFDLTCCPRDADPYTPQLEISSSRKLSAGKLTFKVLIKLFPYSLGFPPTNLHLLEIRVCVLVKVMSLCLQQCLP